MTTCRKCKRKYSQFEGNFYKSANYRHGYNNICIRCVSLYNKEYNKKIKNGHIPKIGLQKKETTTISKRQANKYLKIAQSLILKATNREVGYDWLNSTERKTLIDAGLYYKEFDYEFK